MLDPEPAGRAAPPHHGSPPSVLGGGKVSPTALQILMTEHWSLLGSRSMGLRGGDGARVDVHRRIERRRRGARAVAQATDFGDGFVAFALVLLPVVFFLGVTTIARLSQVNWEDATGCRG